MKEKGVNMLEHMHLMDEPGGPQKFLERLMDKCEGVPYITLPT